MITEQGTPDQFKDCALGAFTPEPGEFYRWSPFCSVGASELLVLRVEPNLVTFRLRHLAAELSDHTDRWAERLRKGYLHKIR